MSDTMSSSICIKKISTCRPRFDVRLRQYICTAECGLLMHTSAAQTSLAAHAGDAHERPPAAFVLQHRLSTSRSRSLFIQKSYFTCAKQSRDKGGGQQAPCRRCRRPRAAAGPAARGCPARPRGHSSRGRRCITPADSCPTDDPPGCKCVPKQEAHDRDHHAKLDLTSPAHTGGTQLLMQGA